MIDSGAASPLRTAVRMYRRSVRAGAFACELATRRPWLGARDAHWIAENLSALRGTAVETTGTPPDAGVAALVIAEPSHIAALAVLAAAPLALAAMGPSLSARAEPWWPRGTGAPVLLTTDDADELERLAGLGARVVPVAVELSCPPPLARLSRSLPWQLRVGVTRARLHFGAAIELEPGQDGRALAGLARDEIERLERLDRLERLERDDRRGPAPGA
jgi:hypothetical protein